MSVWSIISFDDASGIRRLCRTVEYGVGNEAAGVDSLVTNLGKRLAVTVVQRIRALVLPPELVRVVALHIPPMILVEAGELVVEEDRCLEVGGNVELDGALRLRGRWVGRDISEGPLWCCVLCGTVG